MMPAELIYLKIFFIGIHVNSLKSDTFSDPRHMVKCSDGIVRHQDEIYVNRL